MRALLRAAEQVSLPLGAQASVLHAAGFCPAEDCPGGLLHSPATPQAQGSARWAQPGPDTCRPLAAVCLTFAFRLEVKLTGKTPAR